METRELIFVTDPYGDWEGLYVNGRLVHEGHSLTAWQALDALGIDYRELEADEAWMEGRGRLPESLDAVVFSQGSDLP